MGPTALGIVSILYHPSHVLHAVALFGVSVNAM